ncbi:MAG: TonB-dependent receptor plug domain-containing protein [Saprospiraceae bacterium]
MSTGAGISKPVIRGLYGNRILVLLNGLRFDNQQWQDEHSLGLSLNGIGDIEIIRGPFSILYGTEAIGGVINVIDSEFQEDSLLHSEAGLQIHSNTLGVSAFYSTGRFRHNKHWKLLASAENHADYSDGRNERVINSRSDAYQLRWMSGFRKKKWTSTNNLQSSFNRAGFIINDLDSFVVRDQRWSRNLGVNPAHYVLINSATSQNSIQLNRNTLLQLNTGLQSNNRLENEGSGAISLNMHLLTWQYIARLELNLNPTNKLIISNLFLVSNNKNYGARKIIPDALNQEANLSGYLETSIHPHLVIEME